MGVWRIHGSFGWRHDVVVLKSDFALRGSVVPAYLCCVWWWGQGAANDGTYGTYDKCHTYIRMQKKLSSGVPNERAGCSTT